MDLAVVDQQGGSILRDASKAWEVVFEKIEHMAPGQHHGDEKQQVWSSHGLPGDCLSCKIPHDDQSDHVVGGNAAGFALGYHTNYEDDGQVEDASPDNRLENGKLEIEEL